jgi:hypothetical protein
VPLETGTNPALAVFVAGLPTTGTLTVRVTPPLDGVQVFLNDVNKGSTTHGNLTLSGLQAGAYTVRVAKDNYDSSPPARHPQLSAGGRTTVSFNLHASVPPEASLRIVSAIPGSQVFLNGSQVGVVSPAGVFDEDHILPGPYTIRLEHVEYEPWQRVGSFVAGQTATLPATQQRLWLVLINTAPVPTSITYRKAGDAQNHPAHPTEWLLPGSYTFTAH